MSETDELYSITEVARSFNLSIPTLRYYEEQGLIAPSARIGRVRHFDRAALCTLAYALLWHQGGGLSLDTTRELMQPSRSTERNQLITRQLDRIEEKIRLLEGAKATLQHLLQCPSDDPGTCPHTGEQLRKTVAAALRNTRANR